MKNYKNFTSVKEQEIPMPPGPIIPKSHTEREMPVREQKDKKTTPITPKTLSPEIVEAMNQRIAGEYNAHYTYRNAANWCKNMNYKKAAAFFEAEAATELDHAKWLQEYLTQWNILPQIPATPPPPNFSTMVEIINTGYEVEYNLLTEYSSMQHKLCETHPASFNFIQKFVDIQNDSVGEYSDLLNALCLIDINNKLDLLMFEERYF